MEYVGRLTVVDIKKNEGKLKHFSQRMGMKEARWEIMRS